jgi:hypothetical protein
MLLTAKMRKKLPTSAFAIPESRSYPIHDKNHARAALSMVSRFGSPEEKAKVRAAVQRRYPDIGPPDDPDRDGDAAADAAGGDDMDADDAAPSGVRPRR